MIGETSRRSRRLTALYEAHAVPPQAEEPMTAALHTRLQKAVLMETLTFPEGADIRELCHRLAHPGDEDAGR